MGILTVMCYEQARLFEYFSAPVSQAGCSFVKALYCISFLCQSPFPVAVPCQTMTPGFLQVAWRRACHEPRGLTASHWTTLETPLCPSVCLLSSHSGSHFSFFPPFFPFYCFFYSHVLHPSSIYLLLPLLQYFICHLLTVLLLPVSTPPFLFASLLPSSLCPTVQVRRGSVRRFLSEPQVQTTPCEGDFWNCCQ